MIKSGVIFNASSPYSFLPTSLLLQGMSKATPNSFLHTEQSLPTGFASLFFFFFYDTPWQTNRIILAISLIASHWLASLFHRKGFCWPCTYISFWSYWRARCIQFMLLAHSAIYLVLMWWEIYFRCWKHCLENNFQSKDERYDHCFLCVSGWSGLPFLLEHIQMLGRFLYSRFGCFTSYRSKEMFTSSCG